LREFFGPFRELIGVEEPKCIEEEVPIDQTDCCHVMTGAKLHYTLGCQRVG
jgi:hypothetical protein